MVTHERYEESRKWLAIQIRNMNIPVDDVEEYDITLSSRRLTLDGVGEFRRLDETLAGLDVESSQGQLYTLSKECG